MTREEAITVFKAFMDNPLFSDVHKAAFNIAIHDIKLRAEIEQLPTNTRINWDGCCPDIDYPEIEYVDVSKAGLLEIIDKYKAESENP